MMARRELDRDQAMYIISVAAELAGVHPQTLRVYERKGLLRPQRTEGNTRRYSERDIDLLRKIQQLTQDGVNLAGVMKVIELEGEIEALRRRCEAAVAEARRAESRLQQLMDAREHASLVPFKEMRRIRRALKSDVIDAAARPRTFAVPPVQPPD